MIRTAGALSAAFALLATACAPAAPPQVTAAVPRDQCFYADAVSGFAAVSDTLVHVRVGANDVYAFELLGACPQIDWANQIAIESRGSSWICSGLDAIVVAPSAIGPQRCPVRKVTKLTAAQVAALTPGQRP